MTKLTNKQKKFIDEYMIDFNATRSAIKAGYSKKTAKVIGAENLTKPYIKKEIERRQKIEHDEAIIKREEVLRQLTDIANGKPSINIHYESVKNVDGIKSKRITKGKKTADTDQQLKALELLGKHYGLFTDRQEVAFEGAVCLKMIYKKRRH